MKKYYFVPAFVLILQANSSLAGDTLKYNSPGAYNPLVPGYFADPSIKKFGDTYYLYATTDGVMLASGDPQVWISKDFVNWYDYKMEVPKTTINAWAPDVVIGPDGRYYYFHGSCPDGCSTYGYVSDSPIGPWERLNTDNSPILPSYYVSKVLSLDAQILKDNDSTYYAFFCTWAETNGMGWAKFNPDMKSFSKKGTIPSSQLKEVFEGAYPLKRNGKYYMMYSSGDCKTSTYRVQYAIGDTATGPYIFGANNPILSTSSDKTIDGPGHHSVLQEGDNYYICYHRHDNPHSGGGEFRQVCADSMLFNAEGNILKVVPSHKGIGYLGPNQLPGINYAFGKKAYSDSHYKLVVEGSSNYDYLPACAVDDNNGTMWRGGDNCQPHWLMIDFDSIINVKRVLTQFEYSTYYYQYMIEYSTDSLNWTIYSDKRNNLRPGSPMMDEGNVDARFLRITVTNTERAGMYAAIWNIKVYDTISDFSPIRNAESTHAPAGYSTRSALVELVADSIPMGYIPSTIPNYGTLGGTFQKSGNPKVEVVAGVKAISFDGNDYLAVSKNIPSSLSWNSSFTIACWVFNARVGNSECLVAWSNRGGPQGSYAALNYGTNGGWGAAAHWESLDMSYHGVPTANAWHHIVLSFDGMVESIYVDGVLNKQAQRNLFVWENSPIHIAWSMDNSEYFSGSMASLRMYDQSFSAEEVSSLMDVTQPVDTLTSKISETIAGKSAIQVSFRQSDKKIVVENKFPDNPISSVKIISQDGKVIIVKNNINNNRIEINQSYAGLYIVAGELKDKMVFFRKVLVY